jgi:hypothetical protein
VATLPKSRFWERTDVAGAEHVVFDDRRGLLARGSALAVDPIAYAARYELITDDRWATTRLEVTAEGGGWQRTLRLERAAGRWRAATGEQGDLDAAYRAAGRGSAPFPGTEEPERLESALDVDLGGSPLTNTLPVRRLDLLNAAPGTRHRLNVVWVLLPSLQVVAAEQFYTAAGDGKVQYSSGNFSAELTLDGDGFVVSYPGLARRK